MKIGVVSDSHGNLDFLKLAGEALAKKHGAELLVHLGDDSVEAEVLQGLGVPVLSVPGVYEERYRDRAIPNRRIEVYGGWVFLISHTKAPHENDSPDDINPETVLMEKGVEVVLHGHSHIPSIEVMDGVLFVNPGHLKPEDKKGFAPGYALVETAPESVTVNIYHLHTGEMFKNMEKRKEKKRPG
jgi:putative phosphoesterase